MVNEEWQEIKDVEKIIIPEGYGVIVFYDTGYINSFSRREIAVSHKDMRQYKFVKLPEKPLPKCPVCGHEIISERARNDDFNVWRVYCTNGDGPYHIYVASYSKEQAEFFYRNICKNST